MLTARQRLAKRIEPLVSNPNEKECDAIITELKKECKGEDINDPLNHLKETFPTVIIDAYIEATQQRCADPNNYPEKTIAKLVTHMADNKAKLDALDMANQ